MPSAGLEPTIPVRKWQQTYSLDRRATAMALVLIPPALRWSTVAQKPSAVAIMKNGVYRDERQILVTCTANPSLNTDVTSFRIQALL
jgi:hypothetical protein